MKPMPRRCLAVIPALNEQGAIGGVINEIRELAPGFDILVVDDGSTDRTRHISIANGARVASLPFNCGIGGAMQTGFRFAHRHGYEIVVQVDGDGQHDPGQLGRLTEPLLDNRANIVLGSRRLGDGRTLYEPHWWRRLGVWSTALVTSAVIGQRVTDGTSSFRAYDRKAIALFAQEYPHGFLETIEATATARWHDLTIVEVPATIRARRHGTSTISVRRSLYFALHVALSLSVGWLRRRQAHADDARGNSQ